jgi:hypothetical protein
MSMSKEMRRLREKWQLRAAKDVNFAMMYASTPSGKSNFLEGYSKTDAKVTFHVWDSLNHLENWPAPVDLDLDFDAEY